MLTLGTKKVLIEQVEVGHGFATQDHEIWASQVDQACDGGPYRRRGLGERPRCGRVAVVCELDGLGDGEFAFVRLGDGGDDRGRRGDCLDASSATACADPVPRGQGKVALDASGRAPSILHWGADLGPLGVESADALRTTAVPALLNSSSDVARVMSVWPTERDGWSGTPAQEGNAAGTATAPRPELESFTHDPAAGGGGVITLRFADRDRRIELLVAEYPEQR